MRRSASLTLLAVLVPFLAGAQQAAPAVPQAPPETAVSESPPAGEAAGSRRVLAAHRFEPSSLVVDPFATSSVGLRVGYLYGTSSAPKLTGRLSESCCSDLSFAGFGGDVEGSIGLARWLGLRLGLTTVVYTGIDKASVLSVGSGLRTGAWAQLAPSFEVGDRVRVGFLLGASETPTVDILVLSGLIDAVEKGDISSADVLQTSNTVRVDAGASVAWAIARYLGLTATVEYLAPQNTGAGVSAADGISSGAALDLDVGELTSKAPVGVSLGYRVIAPIGSSSTETQHDARVGVYYTGRPGLTLRGELGFRKFYLRETELLSDAGALDFFMRYDW